MKAKNLIIIALSVITLGFVSCEKEHAITFEELPDAAQTIVTTYFADKTVAVVNKDGRTYEVIFSDADNIEFDKDGDWTSINCKNLFVPTALVPTQITTYVTSTYPTALIWGIEKDGKYTDVDLDSGLELRFDKNYNITEVDS